MRLQKTSGEQGSPPKPPVRNSPLTEKPALQTPVSQTAKTSPLTVLPPAGPPAASRSAAALTAALGLPADKLSASVVSFARFFSLPLKPELLAAIRKQAAAPAGRNPAGKETGETGALAAAAAESKGVKLSPGGLEAYAAAIDPDRRSRQDTGEKDGRGRRDENTGEAGKENTGKIPLSGPDLKEKVLEYSEKNPLLAVLNSLPGKNGQRWVVLPFDYNAYGKKLQVSMRVLFEGETPGTTCVRQMVLDIAGSGEKLVFSVKQPAGGELSLNTGIPAHCIAVKNSEEKFPCERDGYGDILPSVSELV